MRHLARASIVAASMLIYSSCASSHKEVVETKPAAPATPTVKKTTLRDVGLLDVKQLDRSVSPCDDFYQFACGGLLASLEIPPDKSSIGPWEHLEERNEAELKRILEAAVAAPSPDPLTRQIGDFYAACMDEAAVEATGVKPIEPLLARSRQVRDTKSLTLAVIDLHRHGVWPLFDLYSAQDFKDATLVIANMDQSGMGLPDRDLYLKDDARAQEVRAAYLAHVERMFLLLGFKAPQAKKAAADVLEIETGLARISKSPVEMRDPQGIYNRIDRAGLKKATPGFPWDDYFQGIGRAGLQSISVSSVAYFEGLNTLLSRVRPPAWSNYLQWHVVHSMAGALPKAFVDEDFKLQAVLHGARALQDRYKRCIDATDRALGEVLAQPYVRVRFGDTSKQTSEQMIRQISGAFDSSLDKNAWMDDNTRTGARAKLETLVYNIGYPKKWRTYEFRIDRSSHAENVLAARNFDLQFDLDKIGRPVDRNEWGMTPPTVNAYYNPTKNEMMFPAGILQPPFFDPQATVPVNMGAMGMIVGHELTHGFDDEGSQFDPQGNMKNWWTADVGNRYAERTRCLVSQYEQYEPLPGIKLNGKLTLGENIADNGGIKMAFRAYRALRKGATEIAEADGFNEDQQFFLAFAQAWCTRTRDELVKLLAKVDPHSPPKFRINGPLSNMPEFAAAFSCAAGTPMNPEKKCEVW